MTPLASLAYLNGRFLPLHEAALPLHDAGFVFGATVVDFCRTFRHRLFRRPDHLARFRHDCAACSIPLPGDVDLTAVAEELVAHNAALLAPGQELAVITFATPGPIPYYLGDPGGAGSGPATVGLHTFRLPLERYESFFREGVILRVPFRDVLNPSGLVSPRVKHRSRLHWWLADRALRADPGTPPGALALLYDARTGSLTETAIGNLLVVERGTVRTPRRDAILDGISLRVVEELCGELGIPFEEGPISLESCSHADEAMLCGTAFCLAGVRQIDRHSIPWPGPILQRLLAKWGENVGVDIARQILPDR